MKPILYVGNKNYSSWSLRPWLVLRWAGIDFEERLIDLRQPGYGKLAIEEVLEVSPTGAVPALSVGDLTVWDSLAIAEWAAEEAPDAGLWPADRRTRALARSATSEMHSGFGGVRRDLPMNLHRRSEAQDWPEDTQRGIDRIISLWQQLRSAHGADGPWLLGQRTIADAFYAPVVTRFRTYSVALPRDLEPYGETVLSDADFLDWQAAGEPDSFDSSGLAVIDGLYR